MRLTGYTSLSKISCNSSLTGLLEFLRILASCHAAQLSLMSLGCLIVDYTFLRGRAKTPYMDGFTEGASRWPEKELLLSPLSQLVAADVARHKTCDLHYAHLLAHSSPVIAACIKDHVN